MIHFFIGHSLDVLNLSNYEIFLIMKSHADVITKKGELYTEFTSGDVDVLNMVLTSLEPYHGGIWRVKSLLCCMY